MNDVLEGAVRCLSPDGTLSISIYLALYLYFSLSAWRFQPLAFFVAYLAPSLTELFRFVHFILARLFRGIRLLGRSFAGGQLPRACVRACVRMCVRTCVRACATLPPLWPAPLGPGRPPVWLPGPLTA
jgi:hypothetical protein